MNTIEVVAAIIKDSNTILATKRGYGEYKNYWEFPGGKIEPGETKEVALHREIKEELDVEIDIQELFTTVDYDYPKFHLTMYCFLCTLIKGELKLLEHNDAVWAPVHQLNSFEWLPADIQVINLIQTNLGGHQ
jgi:8-oxo-dGTP diphosphatase